MAKVCPYSMAIEPSECYQEDCMAWNDGECLRFTSEPLSHYYMAKNAKSISENTHWIKRDIEALGQEIKKIREGR